MKLFIRKRVTLAAFLLAGLMISAAVIVDSPQASITNGIISAKLYLPDPDNGYYRAARFDWSGVISDLEYKGHTYFGQWYTRYDPKINDAIMGPVEDFSPLGYDDVKPGESFVKIGIGVLTKISDSPYAFTAPYEIINGGKWSVKTHADRVEFSHVLNDKNYSYEYEKTVQLVKGKPDMVLMHTLKNTGNKPIETSVYNHNFFMFDNQPIGPDYKVKFPFNLTGEGRAIGDRAKLQDNEIQFSRNVERNENVHFTSLFGYSDNASDYDIRIENSKTGSGVRIRGDKPLSRLVFWSSPKTLCPEPYIHIKINPGETFSWNISYNFYTLQP